MECVLYEFKYCPVLRFDMYSKYNVEFMLIPMLDTCVLRTLTHTEKV